MLDHLKTVVRARSRRFLRREGHDAGADHNVSSRHADKAPVHPSSRRRPDCPPSQSIPGEPLGSNQAPQIKNHPGVHPEGEQLIPRSPIASSPQFVADSKEEDNHSSPSYLLTGGQTHARRAPALPVAQPGAKMAGPDADVDYTVHVREPVTHETVQPHVHHVYQPRRTRSIHFHEHMHYVQPIIDPEPEVAPEPHWHQLAPASADNMRRVDG